MRISDWSSDVCSSDLYPTSSDAEQGYFRRKRIQTAPQPLAQWRWCRCHDDQAPARIHLLPPGSRPRSPPAPTKGDRHRSEEHTSELQSLMRISYAVFCLKKKKKHKQK